MGVNRRLRAGRAVQALLLIEVAVFSFSTIPGVRSEPGLDTLLDGWLQGAAYVTTAVLATLGVFSRRTRHRSLWGFVAAALILRALAFVAYLAFVRHQDPVPYPSVADIGWLGMSLVLLVGMAMMARRQIQHMPGNVALDGLLGAFATAAVAYALLYDTLVSLTTSVPAEVVATNLAYPILDVALLLMIIGVFLAFRWHPPTPVVLLAVGVAGFAIVDCVYLYQAAAGTYRPGTPLAALSLVATSVIALSPWVRRRRGAPAFTG